MYSALCAVLELGLAIADTAADALMVSYSTAESLKERGTIMSHCYALRFFAGTCSSLAVAVLYNGVDEGGDSSWSLTLGYAGHLPLNTTQSPHHITAPLASLQATVDCGGCPRRALSLRLSAKHNGTALLIARAVECRAQRPLKLQKKV